MTGPATNAILPPSALTRRIMSATRFTGGFDAALRRHLVAHEAERRLVARLHVGRDAHALHAAHDEIALADIAQLLQATEI